MQIKWFEEVHNNVLNVWNKILYKQVLIFKINVIHMNYITLMCLCVCIKIDNISWFFDLISTLNIENINELLKNCDKIKNSRRVSTYWDIINQVLNYGILKTKPKIWHLILKFNILGEDYFLLECQRLFTT